jgi:hypothetical protein
VQFKKKKGPPVRTRAMYSAEGIDLVPPRGREAAAPESNYGYSHDPSQVKSTLVYKLQNNVC